MPLVGEKYLHVSICLFACPHTHTHKPNQKQNLRLLKYSELSITYLTINKRQTYLTSGAKSYATYTSLPRDPLGVGFMQNLVRPH